MSDFDKEAERRRLREKYERDQQKRQSTQRMSELLLKGATMTNHHCDECGNPIFRHDGREFCPSCQDARVVDSADPNEADAGGADQQGGGADTGAGADGDGPSVGTPRESRGGRPEAGDGSAGGGQPAGDAVEATARRVDPATREPSRQPPRPDSDVESLDDARASLRRSVARYAAAGERAEDPRRARERFAAAREAAEALVALER